MQDDRITRALSREQQLAVLAAASQHDANRRESLMLPLVRLMLVAGLRVREALRLRYDEDKGLHLRSRRFTVTPLKAAAGTARIGLGPVTCSVLSTHQQATHGGEGDLVFSDPLAGGPVAYDRLTAAWGDVRHRSGMERVRIHDLRYSHGSTLFAAGMNVAEVSKRMRHASSSTTLDANARERNELAAPEDWYDRWLAEA